MGDDGAQLFTDTPHPYNVIHHRNGTEILNMFQDMFSWPIKSHISLDFCEKYLFLYFSPEETIPVIPKLRASPGSVPPLSLLVPGEGDGPGEAVGEHVEDGQLDVGDEDPLLSALLLHVPEVRHPLQSPGRQTTVELLLVRQPEWETVKFTFYSSPTLGLFLRPNKLWISFLQREICFASQFHSISCLGRRQEWRRRFL